MINRVTQSAASTSVVQGTGLTKSYRSIGADSTTPGPARRGRTTVLRGADFAADAGEFVAIVGRSGSGKSTLLHCLAGLTPVDSGSVTLCGQDLTRTSATDRARLRRETMGIVFQDLNLIESLTVRQNIELPVRLAGRRPQRRTIDALLDRVGLTALASRRPAQLSGGQQQRVAVARVLAAAPPVVFADEPTGSLDVETTASVLALLREVTRAGSALVMVTHDVEVAATADRVVVIDHGRCVTELRRPSPAQVLDALQQPVPA